MPATTFGTLAGLKRFFLTLDWTSTTYKMMLVGPGKDPDVHDAFVDEGAGSWVDYEIDVDGYERGFGGSGRKVITGKDVSQNNNLETVVLDMDDVDFGNLGGGTTEVDVAGAWIVKEGTSDANSVLMFFCQFQDRRTDGGNFTAFVPSAGLWSLQTGEEPLL